LVCFIFVIGSKEAKKTEKWALDSNNMFLVFLAGKTVA
jgi:hypothetical protein